VGRALLEQALVVGAGSLSPAVVRVVPGLLRQDDGNVVIVEVDRAVLVRTGVGKAV
jgi:hypothetical protein